MDPLVTLTCPDDGRRSEIAEALAHAGIELTESFDVATLDIVDDTAGLLIRDNEESLIQLSLSLPPDDIVGLVRVALDITTLREAVRSFEDSESASVIAANIAMEARDALVPVLFSADALAGKSVAAAELTNLVIAGLNGVMNILLRITPVQRGTATSPTCANTVIGELAGTMRVMAHPTKLVTRLENPLPPVAVERTNLERMLLNLVANAADAMRIVVATTQRTVTTVAPAAVPAGDWIVVEVESDGPTMSHAAREQLLRPSSPALRGSRAPALGLASIARVTRSAGGHISIDDSGRKVEIWLPRAATN